MASTSTYVAGPTPRNAFSNPYRALSAVCAFSSIRSGDWLPFTTCMGFTLEMLCRSILAPAVSSLKGHLVSQRPVLLILMSVRWEISDATDR